MAQRTRFVDFLAVTVEPSAAAPLNRQIYDAVVSAIMAGTLRPGDRLPSSRALAKSLAVGRNTVLLAFEQLGVEGFLDTRHGSGTFVSTKLVHQFLDTVRPRPDERSDAGPARVARRAARYSEVPPSLKKPQRIVPFRLNMPALDAFPTEIWSDLTRSLLRQHRRPGGIDLLGEAEAAGHGPLREAIARHVAAARGVVCEPEQVVIVAGAQQGIDIAVRLLLDPGDAAWCEDPGFPGAIAAVRAGGGEVVPVPVDREGLEVDIGERLAPRARLAVVCPSAQFPLGVTLSLRRRLALLDWAHRSDAWIIEDDYDSEFRHDGRPIASLQGLDRGRRVVYLGTFSKVLFPSLRLAYMIVPPELTELVVNARVVCGRHSPVLEQALVTRFMDDGHFVRHIRRMRTLYAARRAALARAVGRHLGGLVRLQPGETGLQTMGWLCEGWSDAEVSRAAASEGIEIAPLSRFTLNRPLPPGLVLGFGAFAEDALDEGAARLARILSRIPAGPAGSGRDRNGVPFDGGPVGGEADGDRDARLLGT